jgi:hypothetical protein
MTNADQLEQRHSSEQEESSLETDETWLEDSPVALSPAPTILLEFDSQRFRKLVDKRGLFHNTPQTPESRERRRDLSSWSRVLGSGTAASTASSSWGGGPNNVSPTTPTRRLFEAFGNNDDAATKFSPTTGPLGASVLYFSPEMAALRRLNSEPDKTSRALLRSAKKLSFLALESLPRALLQKGINRAIPSPMVAFNQSSPVEKSCEVVKDDKRPLAAKRQRDSTPGTAGSAAQKQRPPTSSDDDVALRRHLTLTSAMDSSPEKTEAIEANWKDFYVGAVLLPASVKKLGDDPGKQQASIATATTTSSHKRSEKLATKKRRDKFPLLLRRHGSPRALAGLAKLSNNFEHQKEDQSESCSSPLPSLLLKPHSFSPCGFRGYHAATNNARPTRNQSASSDLYLVHLSFLVEGTLPSSYDNHETEKKPASTTTGRNNERFTAVSVSLPLESNNAASLLVEVLPEGKTQLQVHRFWWSWRLSLMVFFVVFAFGLSRLGLLYADEMDTRMPLLLLWPGVVPSIVVIASKKTLMSSLEKEKVVLHDAERRAYHPLNVLTQTISDPRCTPAPKEHDRPKSPVGNAMANESPDRTFPSSDDHLAQPVHISDQFLGAFYTAKLTDRGGSQLPITTSMHKTLPRQEKRHNGVIKRQNEDSSNPQKRVVEADLRRHSIVTRFLRSIRARTTQLFYCVKNSLSRLIADSILFL